MKKFIVHAAILLSLVVASTAQATEIKLGGGIIFENTVPGGVIAVDIPISDSHWALSVSADYFKKDYHSTLPVALRAQYKTSIAEKTYFYLGAGGGIFYEKEDAHGNVPSHSATHALFSSVGGLDLKLSDKMGVFSEITFDRALVSGAKNEIALKGGIFFSVGGHH